ncbi:hypothetical protein GCM10007390_26040 [Persicitalea jodogahamensis]|uniref:Uncharacterized protein n=1 Tax=Persicitalea jodogahamensis TaxID=402147 RepID=A0A8J3D2N1_9BACT|nr:hypothetical protein GCM10007390_26040 [Persicitalea jodogahamensis]
MTKSDHRQCIMIFNQYLSGCWDKVVGFTILWMALFAAASEKSPFNVIDVQRGQNTFSVVMRLTD